MLTKTQYARMIVDRYIRENCRNRPVKDPAELVKYVYSSTKLGIALEQLGIITEYSAHHTEWEYLQHRSGVEFVHYDEETKQAYTLTTRELFALLPDEMGGQEV